MPEITLKLDDPSLFAEQLKHAAEHWDDGRATPIGQALHMAAFQIREQVKPAVDEPTEFGSVISATCGGERMRWQQAQDVGYHYWRSITGVVEVWSELTDVEVLRVGIGEQSDEWQRLDVANAQTDAYAEGAEALRTRVLADLRFLLSSAITAERKDAYETAIRAVEEVQP